MGEKLLYLYNYYYSYLIQKQEKTDIQGAKSMGFLKGNNLNILVFNFSFAFSIDSELKFKISNSHVYFTDFEFIHYMANK